MIRLHVLAMVIGFLMDLCLGDPLGFWHPVRGIGWLTAKGETVLRRICGDGRKRALISGGLLVFCVLTVTGACTGGVLYLAYKVHLYVGLAVESFLCYQILAVKSLKAESMKVYDALTSGDVEKARYAVSMIVGRDTAVLTDIGITKAAVETVAENTSDGVIAPLLYIALGGALGGMLYKAVNTMDSMVGYKNDQYLYFGRAAARLDDICGFLPARLAALLMICASLLPGMDSRNAAKIYRRDRYKHKSPNSAHTEAVCAGALGVELAGNAWYFGELHEKPVIGDPLRPIEYEDIRRANRLLYGASCLGVTLLAVGMLLMSSVCT